MFKRFEAEVLSDRASLRDERERRFEAETRLAVLEAQLASVRARSGSAIREEPVAQE